MTVYIEGIGKITASTDTLNTLAMIAGDASEHYTAHEYFALAKQAKDMDWTIYKALKKAGYYDGV